MTSLVALNLMSNKFTKINFSFEKLVVWMGRGEWRGMRKDRCEGKRKMGKERGEREREWMRCECQV